MEPKSTKVTGLVFSGGGARGAYGAGVISYLCETLVRNRRCVPRMDIITGSSVGAVNGTLLASVVDDPIAGVQKLCSIWQSLELSDVLKFGVRQLTMLPKVIWGGQEAVGVFDASPLSNMINREISWKNIATNLALHKLRALSVTATHLSTGQPTVFVDLAPDANALEISEDLLRRFGRGIRVRCEPIAPAHVLASSAIPILFPPVPVRGSFYCDGGLRFNTPMAPAIHLGATHLLVVGASAPQTIHTATTTVREGHLPGLPFLIGKVLNAFLLDRVRNDLAELERINRMIEDGEAAYGPDFQQKMGAQAEHRGHPPRRRIHTLGIHPSVDIGKMASDYLRTHHARFGRVLGRSFLRLLDVGEGADADLASYVLFDGDYARHLIELGRHDAAAQRDALEDLLFD